MITPIGLNQLESALNCLQKNNIYFPTYNTNQMIIPKSENIIKIIHKIQCNIKFDILALK